MLDKPYSDPEKTNLIGYFWSGKHKKAVKGLNLITLYYTYCLNIENLLNQPSDLLLAEQIPASRHEKIEVRLNQTRPKIELGEMAF